MPPTPDQEKPAAADAGGINGGQGGCEGSVPEVAADAKLPHLEGDGHGHFRGEEIPEDAPSGDAARIEVDSEHSGGSGDSAYQREKSARISKKAFRAAVIAANGNRSNVSRAIGCTVNTVCRRIAADPELNALYGDAHGDAPERSPGAIKAMDRRPEDLEAMGIELVDQVAAMDREMYRDALRNYGVSERQLIKLKALDGLAKNGGRLLSVSLQMTHQNYVGQLHNLAEVADTIREKMGADGIDAESYSYLAKIYVECVKEAGKGYALMMTGTEAMVRMMAASKSTAPSEKATSGWGPMKKVRKAEPAD